MHKGSTNAVASHAHGKRPLAGHDRRPAQALQPHSDAAPPPRHRELGLTLCELMVCLVLITILTTMVLGILDGRIERARLVQCFVNIRSIQSKVWSMSDGIQWPDPATFWDYAWAGKKPGPYYYLANSSDANRGHGNDMDFCDEENPGRSRERRDCQDIRFVILCQHNHHNLANYVYIKDEGPPTLAGWSRGTNPGFDRYVSRVP